MPSIWANFGNWSSLILSYSYSSCRSDSACIRSSEKAWVYWSSPRSYKSRSPLTKSSSFVCWLKLLSSFCFSSLISFLSFSSSTPVCLASRASQSKSNALVCCFRDESCVSRVSYLVLMIVSSVVRFAFWLWSVVSQETRSERDLQFKFLEKSGWKLLKWPISWLTRTN